MLSPERKVIVAGILPGRGHRLQRIEEVIIPRIRELQGLPDGIAPMNVNLLFRATIEDTLQQLVDTVVNESLPDWEA